MLIRASAPGKLVLCGEYAVLDGANSIAMAVNRRAFVDIRQGADGASTVSSPGLFDSPVEFTVAEGQVVAIANESRDLGLLASVLPNFSSPPADYVLDSRALYDKSGEKLGLGSSAALCVALCGALSGKAGSASTLSEAIALHRAFQQSRGSGIDVATAMSGGVIQYSISPEPTVYKVDWPESLLYRVFWSGKSASTTEKLKRLAASGESAERDELFAASNECAASWVNGDAGQVLRTTAGFTESLRVFSARAGLDVFAAGHGRMHEQAKAMDVVYKPCGAGGGDIGIAMATGFEQLDAFSSVVAEAGFSPIDLVLEGDGLIVSSDEQA